MQTHDLKTWPSFFADIMSGAKTFELRRDDRGFAVGDILHLREWDPKTEHYSGQSTYVKVAHLLHHDPVAGCAATFGLRDGFVIMSIANTGA